MPYPQVTQFETLDRRRPPSFGTAAAQKHVGDRPGRRRSGLSHVWPLRRTPGYVCGDPTGHQRSL
jgi:hypothetical protein